MRFLLACPACFLAILAGGCANTGHSLSSANLPDRASWEADTTLQFRLQAPSSIYPLGWRLRSPKLAFSNGLEFRDPIRRRCDRASENGTELVIRCTLPTHGVTPGTTFYYRLEYTFDGYREGKFRDLHTLEVGSNCPNNAWWMKGEEFGCY